MDKTMLYARITESGFVNDPRSALQCTVYCIYSAKSSSSSNVYSLINLGMIHWMRSGWVTAQTVGFADDRCSVSVDKRK